MKAIEDARKQLQKEAIPVDAVTVKTSSVDVVTVNTTTAE
jgi:hypothetical protein